MARKKETITLSIPPGTKEQLEELARRLNILWGKEPSVSGLIVAIAQKQLEVGQPFTLNRERVNALMPATTGLVDAGNIEAAQIVLALLLDKGTLETPLRQSLLKQVSDSRKGWRLEIDNLIDKKQPFHLLYRNPQDQELEYTVRYGEICFYEKRSYLLVWCDETQDAEKTIPNLPELWHNRCLRLDRVVSILPISGDWRGQLDYLKVQLHFKRGLVKSYEFKEDDLEEEMNGEVRQVVRKVVNYFWLNREVRRYGKDCVIVSPENVRDCFKQELQELYNLYF
ncbi:helix-turn-helix transcriptional regulator [Synechocystis sp. PCC 7509]|uniref:helix-turn-helix transcriptional regulator n=1 Tax=Synechocystis sp. PCC 7509 TaxID=927677 RepID=UPI0002AC0A6D|nr:WYL domain-containing protein [Synechocystis sp. PCC 7509]